MLKLKILIVLIKTELSGINHSSLKVTVNRRLGMQKLHCTWVCMQGPIQWICTRYVPHPTAVKIHWNLFYELHPFLETVFCSW